MRGLHDAAERLVSENPDMRKDGLQRLHNLVMSGSMSATELKSEVSAALRQLGETRAVRAGPVAALVDENEEIRQASLKVLSYMGTEGLEAVMERVDSGDLVLRRRAVEGLQEIAAVSGSDGGAPAAARLCSKLLETEDAKKELEDVVKMMKAEACESVKEKQETESKLQEELKELKERYKKIEASLHAEESLSKDLELIVEKQSRAAEQGRREAKSRPGGQKEATYSKFLRGLVTFGGTPGKVCGGISAEKFSSSVTRLARINGLLLYHDRRFVEVGVDDHPGVDVLRIFAPWSKTHVKYAVHIKEVSLSRKGSRDVEVQWDEQVQAPKKRYLLRFATGDDADRFVERLRRKGGLRRSLSPKESPSDTTSATSSVPVQ